MSNTPAITDPTTWALDHEIVLVRVLDATRANRFDYLEVVPVERLIMDHGSDIDDDPARLRVTIVLDEQADGKTM